MPSIKFFFISIFEYLKSVIEKRKIFKLKIIIYLKKPLCSAVLSILIYHVNVYIFIDDI